jgi:hypothetical protein
VVADDHRDGAWQLADLVTMKQVGETVKLLRNEDRHARPVGHWLELPAHAELLCGFFKLCQERRYVETIEHPLHAHKEQAGLVVLVLIGVGDVRSELVQEAGKRLRRDPSGRGNR